MTVQRKKNTQPAEIEVDNQEEPIDSISLEPSEETLLEDVPNPPQNPPQISVPPQKTGKIFLGDEDKRLLKQFNNHIIKKLNLQSSRSVKL